MNERVITWIRHGKTRANEEHRYIGRTDLPLSERGKEELRQLWMAEGTPGLLQGMRDSSGEPELVAVSPMQRCLESAKILTGGAVRDIRVIQEWKETDFGDWEMKNWEELSGDPAYQAWIDNGGRLPFPGGESREAFGERTWAGWQIFLDICREEDIRHAVCVVHGGTIMEILSRLTGGDYYDYQTECGHGWRLLCGNHGEIRSLRRIKLAW